MLRSKQPDGGVLKQEHYIIFDKQLSKLIKSMKFSIFQIYMDTTKLFSHCGLQNVNALHLPTSLVIIHCASCYISFLSFIGKLLYSKRTTG